MTQYIEHYRCNNAPCVRFDPPLRIADMNYIMGLSPPRYPLPSVLGQVHINPHCVILDQANYWAGEDADFWRR